MKNVESCGLIKKNSYDLKDRSYEFALQTIRYFDKTSASLSSRILVKQVLRSATSIGANIVEAQASPSRKDFAFYISHALKSANETVYWLRLIRDSSGDVSDKLSSLIQEATELSKILGASLLTI